MTEQAATPILSLEVEHKGDQAIVHCHGRLISEVAGNFYTRVCKLIPDHKCIVLDLCDLSHMDSMGLGTVARLYVSVKSKGGSLQLINMSKSVRHLLGITNLLNVFGDMCEHGVTLGF
jgi:anti-anti-sigma factor